MSEFELVETKKDELPATTKIESARAVQEAQAAMIVAKRFPRDENKAYTQIMKACERQSLAETAMYMYPRGGASITGPSIRLAEVMARAWGNLDYGVRELSQRGGESEIEAYCWDLETNTRQTKTFTVKHGRFTKARGFTDVVDPRDIYEVTANQGARRVRACILGIIPGDVVEAAIKKCEKTLAKGGGSPLVDRVREMLVAFTDYGVTKEMIEERLGHDIKATVEVELVTLRKIFSSLKDGMSTREQWFDLDATDKKEDEELTEELKKKGKGKKKSEKKVEKQLQYDCPNKPDPETGELGAVLALECLGCDDREGCMAHEEEDG